MSEVPGFSGTCQDNVFSESFCAWFCEKIFVSCARIFEAYVVENWVQLAENQPQKQAQERLREYILKKGGFIMKSSKKTYQEVAEACSKYQPVSEEYGFKNSSCECNTPSCLNCTHFTDQEHCDLDLYDQIVERIK